VEVGAEESLLRHCMPSLGIPWDSHAVTGAQIDMRFSGHVTAMPAGVASIPTAPSWRAAYVLRARLRRPDC